MPFTLMDAISLPVSFFLGFPTSLRPDWIRTSNKLFIDLFMSRQLFTAAATDPAPASAPAPDPAAHLSLPAVHRPPLIQQRPHGAHFWGPPPFGIDLFLIFPSQCNFSANSVPIQCHFSAISEPFQSLTRSVFILIRDVALTLIQSQSNATAFYGVHF